MNRQQFLAQLLRKQNIVPVEEGQDCMICKEEYGTPSSETETGETQVRLPCSDKHTVGANCIVQWLQSHNTCPVCRRELFAKERTRAERSEPALIDLLDDEDDDGDGESDVEDEDFVDDDAETDEEDVNMSDVDECVSDEESDGDDEE